MSETKKAPEQQSRYETPSLFDLARRICHANGLRWTDPRTGVTYLPASTKLSEGDRDGDAND